MTASGGAIRSAIFFKRTGCHPSATIHTNSDLEPEDFKVEPLRKANDQLLHDVDEHQRNLEVKLRQPHVGANIKILRSYVDEHIWRCAHADHETDIFHAIKFSYPS